MLSYILLLLIMAVSPLAQIVCGEWVLEHVFAAVRKEHSESDLLVEYWKVYLLVGLFVSLTIVLALCCAGLPLPLSLLLALAPAGLRLARAIAWLRRFRPTPSINFCIWFSFTLALGISLVSSVSGIQTPWQNNYGDLAWHLGMIDSFVFGRNFPPQNHLFAGDTLSYPFFINLWTAALWVFHPTPAALSHVFLYQWMIVWTVIYYAIDGDRTTMAPWAVLFGGGAYGAFRQTIVDLGAAHHYAHELIDKGFPWTPFLTTIWVTQRPAMLGAAVLLAGVQVFHRFLFSADAGREGERQVFFSGALFGTSPLVHTHLFIVGVLYTTFTLAFRAVRQRVLRKHLAWLLLGFFPALFYTPWIVGKSGIIRIAGGWMQDEQSGLLQSFAGGAGLWWQNGLPWLILTLIAALLTKRFLSAAVLALLFLLGNIFQLAVWNWDEIKIFLGIYLISLTLWNGSVSRKAWLGHWLLIFLTLPALTELYVSLKKYERYTVYTSEELELAAKIRRSIPSNAIIAAAPDHNSPVTLTGRRMFYGYEGTLSSHGLNFLPRRAIFQDLDRLLQCVPSDSGPCPDYLLWTEREKKYWNRATPGAALQSTSVPELFKIVRTASAAGGTAASAASPAAPAS